MLIESGFEFYFILTDKLIDLIFERSLTISTFSCSFEFYQMYFRYFVSLLLNNTYLSLLKLLGVFFFIITFYLYFIFYLYQYFCSHLLQFLFIQLLLFIFQYFCKALFSFPFSMLIVTIKGYVYNPFCHSLMQLDHLVY